MKSRLPLKKRTKYLWVKHLLKAMAYLIAAVLILASPAMAFCSLARSYSDSLRSLCWRMYEEGRSFAFELEVPNAGQRSILPKDPWSLEALTSSPLFKAFCVQNWLLIPEVPLPPKPRPEFVPWSNASVHWLSVKAVKSALNSSDEPVSVVVALQFPDQSFRVKEWGELKLQSKGNFAVSVKVERCMLLGKPVPVNDTAERVYVLGPLTKEGAAVTYFMTDTRTITYYLTVYLEGGKMEYEVTLRLKYREFKEDPSKLASATVVVARRYLLP